MSAWVSDEPNTLRAVSTLAGRSLDALQRVLAAKPGATTRPGQEMMVTAVADAIEQRHHLLVEGGTGTGKSLAYLVPAIVSGGVTVVATATKTLQDQLASNDLPFLAAHLGRPVTWAVIKGRQSYACIAKLSERFGDGLDHAPDPTLFPDAADADDAPLEEDDSNRILKQLVGDEELDVFLRIDLMLFHDNVTIS